MNATPSTSSPVPAQASRPAIQVLFDSELYSVVHFPYERQYATLLETFQAHASNTAIQSGFEIVDKRAAREVFLTGAEAAAFERQIREWQTNTPAQAEVEETLEAYCVFAVLPFVVH